MNPSPLAHPRSPSPVCNVHSPHCLGTAHLARTLVESLQRRQPELEVDSKDVQRVTIAGEACEVCEGGEVFKVSKGGKV